MYTIILTRSRLNRLGPNRLGPNRLGPVEVISTPPGAYAGFDLVEDLEVMGVEVLRRDRCVRINTNLLGKRILLSRGATICCEPLVTVSASSR